MINFIGQHAFYLFGFLYLLDFIYCRFFGLKETFEEVINPKNIKKVIFSPQFFISITQKIWVIIGWFTPLHYIFIAYTIFEIVVHFLCLNDKSAFENNALRWLIFIVRIFTLSSILYLHFFNN